MTTSEWTEILTEIAGSNPPNAADAYNRQKRRGTEHNGLHEALRRVLRRFFLSDTFSPQHLFPAAERALQKAAGTIEKRLTR